MLRRPSRGIFPPLTITCITCDPFSDRMFCCNGCGRYDTMWRNPQRTCCVICKPLTDAEITVKEATHFGHVVRLWEADYEPFKRSMKHYRFEGANAFIDIPKGHTHPDNPAGVLRVPLFYWFKEHGAVYVGPADESTPPLDPRNYHEYLWE